MNSEHNDASGSVDATIPPTLESLNALQQQIATLTAEYYRGLREVPATEIKDYQFETLDGQVSLAELFGQHERLLVIHNMGQACRYCTLWGDGLNGFVPHLESTLALVMVSKDSPEVQRRFAQSRGWRFRMASHGGGQYMADHVGCEFEANMPGVACYTRQGTSIHRQALNFFGPGDLYCPMWNLLALAGIETSTWTPQFNYWQRPVKMEDGGENLLPD